MPFLVRPSDQRCQAFMSQPNTYSVNFVTGDIFHFSLPFPMESLDLMRPQELDHLFHFLSSIRADVAEESGQTGVRDLKHVGSVVARRLEDVQFLGPAAWEAWLAERGFPVFDNSHHLISFTFDGKMETFKSGDDSFERTMRTPTGQNDHENFGANLNCSEDPHQDQITVLHWDKNGHEALECRKNGETVEFCIYGGHFMDFAEWELFQGNLTDQELEWLEDGVLAIRNVANGGWTLVCEDFSHQEHGDIRLAPPNTSPCDESCCCTPPVIDTPRKPTSPPPNPPANGLRISGKAANHQSVHFNQPITVCGATFNNLDDWMHLKSTLTKIDLDLLRQGVLSLEGSSNTGIKKTLGWYKGSLVEQALAHTILRDQYRVEMGALSSNVTRLEARFQALRHEQPSKQQSPSRQAGYCSPSCPGYRDLVQSMHPTNSNWTVSGNSAEETDLEGSQFTDISEPDAFHDRIEISPAPRVVLVRPTPQFTRVHPTPLVMNTQRAHYGSGPEPRPINSEQPSAHIGGQHRTVYLQHPRPRAPFVTPSPPASPPRLIVHRPNTQVNKSAQDILPRDDLKTLLKIAKNERTKAHQAQNAGREQVVYIRDVSHQPAPATNVVRRQSSAPKDMNRSRASTQVPIRSNSAQPRLSRRPRATQKALSAVTNQCDPEPNSSRYQVYAEDSPEDSPQPSSGSWRDV